MEFYRSKFKSIRNLVVFAALFCLFVVMATYANGKGRAIGMLLAIPSGYMIVYYPIVLLKTGPSYVIDEDGIDCQHYKYGLVPWKDIRGIWIHTIQGIGRQRGIKIRQLHISVRNPDDYISSFLSFLPGLSKAKRQMAGADIVLSFEDMKPGLDEAWSCIRQLHPDKIGKR